jgi:hypothetical protein
VAEVAVPFGAATGTALTTLQQYRDRIRPTQPDMVDAADGMDPLKVTLTTAGVNVANGGAIVNGARYDLTGGPLFVPAAAAGAANIFNVVVLTMDTSHTPIIYLRNIAGTSGGGLASATLTNSTTGVWDFPIAHYERQPGGGLVNLKDRRKWADGSSGIWGWDDTSGTLGAGWFPPAPRVGQRQRFFPSGITYTWTGSVWGLPDGSSGASVAEKIELTVFAGFTSTTYTEGSPTCAVTMVAPPSGKVFVTTFARGSSDVTSDAMSVTYEVRVTNSSGSVFQAGTDNHCVQASNYGPGYGFKGDACRDLVTGLTPGTTYYFATVHHTITPGQGWIARRAIMVEAVK